MGGGGLKRLRPQRREVTDEMEVERRNMKISGGKEEEEEEDEKEEEEGGLWTGFRHVGAN